MFLVSGPTVAIIFPKLIENYPILLLLTNTAWLALVSKLLYDNSSSVYFWVNRGLMWVINSEVDWSLTVVLSGYREEEVLEKIFSEILNAYPNGKSWHNDQFKKIIELPIGCNIQFEEKIKGGFVEDEQTVFFFKVSELIVPFRHSQQTLELLVSLIGNIVLPIIKPEHEKYSFKVKFGSANPYFGLFVRAMRIPSHSLITFRVEFDEKVGQTNERVDVSNERVALTTKNLHNLQALSKRYITLATLDLTNPQ